MLLASGFAGVTDYQIPINGIACSYDYKSYHLHVILSLFCALEILFRHNITKQHKE